MTKTPAPAPAAPIVADSYEQRMANVRTAIDHLDHLVATGTDPRTLYGERLVTLAYELTAGQDSARAADLTWSLRLRVIQAWGVDPDTGSTEDDEPVPSLEDLAHAYYRNPANL